jgi:hypothetical protein
MTLPLITAPALRAQLAAGARLMVFDCRVAQVTARRRPEGALSRRPRLVNGAREVVYTFGSARVIDR